MHTENRIEIQGDIDQVFAMASAVEEWPRLLPHYRWVKVVSGEPPDRVVEMAAHRDGFPVRWTARQQLAPDTRQIHFAHVRGISRGMEVTWHLQAEGPLVRVRIVHDLTWRWPPIGPFIADTIIGKLFVMNIASKTLHAMKRHIEAGTVL